MSGRFFYSAGEKNVAKKKKLSPRELDRGIDEYFRSISRMVTVTEMIDSGEVDRYGHPVLQPVTVYNQLGQEVKRLEYLIPPTIGGLCEYLGISASTWNSYSREGRYAESVKRARGAVYAYLQAETLTRPDKALGGILFNIENNFADFAPRKQMDFREQELRIRKAEQELDSMEQGSTGVSVELVGEADSYGV